MRADTQATFKLLIYIYSLFKMKIKSTGERKKKENKIQIPKGRQIDSPLSSLKEKKGGEKHQIALYLCIGKWQWKAVLPAAPAPRMIVMMMMMMQTTKRSQMLAHRRCKRKY